MRDSNRKVGDSTRAIRSARIFPEYPRVTVKKIDTIRPTHIVNLAGVQIIHKLKSAENLKTSSKASLMIAMLKSVRP